MIVTVAFNMAATFLLFCTCISIVQGAKILALFPFPANSHFTCNNAVLRSLAKAGHEITVITSFPNTAAKENYTSVIDVSDGEFIYVGQSRVEDFSERSIPGYLEFWRKTEMPACDKILNSKLIKNILKSKKKMFDVIFVEIMAFERCFYWIGKNLNIPVIGVSTFRSWTFADLQLSNPKHPALEPIEAGICSIRDDIFGKVYNTFRYFEFIGLYYWHIMMSGNLDSIYQKYAKSYLSYEEFIGCKPSIIFVNGHSSYYPRPLNPNMIEVGGITITEPKPLPQDLEKFLDGATNGAILFTIGSVIKTAHLPKNKIQAFKEAFAEIPQRVIWKYEEPLEGLSDNVMLMNWVPQMDILAHKKIKAFLNHCGQGAIHETIHYGVPFICLPLFSDQHANAKTFGDLDIIVRLDYETISKDSILRAVNEIINNTQYYEKTQKLTQLFKDRPMTPQQTVVYWTEYVIRHGGAPHLNSPASELNWIQYLLLDVIGFITIVISVIVFIIYYICKSSYVAIKLYCKKSEIKIKSH